jgi:hypothetical protein
MDIISILVRDLWSLTLGYISTVAEESLDIEWACYDMCVCGKVTQACFTVVKNK